MENRFDPFLTQDYWDSLDTDPMWFDPMSSGSDVFLTPEDISDYGLIYPSNSVGRNSEADAKPTKEGTTCFNCECTETPVWRRENGQSICNACKIYDGHRRFIVKSENVQEKKVIRKGRKVTCCVCNNGDATFNIPVGSTNGHEYQCRSCYHIFAA